MLCYCSTQFMCFLLESVRFNSLRFVALYALWMCMWSVCVCLWKVSDTLSNWWTGKNFTHTHNFMKMDTGYTEKWTNGHIEFLHLHLHRLNRRITLLLAFENQKWVGIRKFQPEQTHISQFYSIPLNLLCTYAYTNISNM